MAVMMSQPQESIFLDFRFRDLVDNLLTSSDAFIHAGFQCDEDALEVNTQWVKNKMSRFSVTVRGTQGTICGSEIFVGDELH
jgi:hypothetical protein